MKLPIYAVDALVFYQTHYYYHYNSQASAASGDTYISDKDSKNYEEIVLINADDLCEDYCSYDDCEEHEHNIFVLGEYAVAFGGYSIPNEYFVAGLGDYQLDYSGESAPEYVLAAASHRHRIATNKTRYVQLQNNSKKHKVIYTCKD